MTANEIATRDENAVAPARPAPLPAAESAMEQWARNARVISQVAKSLAMTSFAGTLRGKPEEVTAVILAGDELGLKPMAALKAFDIIQGTPALRAHAMRGLVMSHGHKVQLIESTPERCVYRGRRADEGEDAWQTVTWTLPRADKLGLLGKNEWKKQPQTMLVARATGELCRLIASDVLHGVPYTSEELQDSTVIRGEAAVARPPLSVAALTASTPVAAPATPVTDADESSTDEDDPAWENSDDPEPAFWPAVAQPGAGVPHP